jgi:hypothetical protein
MAYKWMLAGCEMGMYPYVIPFSGAPMSNDPALKPHTSYARRRIQGTVIEWEQPSKILPLDPVVRDVILAVEQSFETWLRHLETRTAHLPSRVRSLIWIICAAPILTMAGESAPDRDEAVEQLLLRLPGLDAAAREQLRNFDLPMQSLAVNA